jgi:succinoglycan biosynthesis transport protein ExoP
VPGTTHIDENIPFIVKYVVKLKNNHPGKETNPLSENQYRPRPEDDEIEIDLRQILAVLRKWSKLIIIMTLLCVLTAGIISYFVLSPVYQASTLLMVTQATDKLATAPPTTTTDGLNNVVDQVNRTPVLTMSSYMGQLKSEALMQRVIKKLKLDPEKYTPAGLAGAIDATIVKDSNLIEVKVNNNDPVVASRIANTLSEQYLAMMTDKNQEQLSRSVTFLNKQKGITDLELSDAQKALEEIQSQPRGVAVLEAEFTKKSEDVVNYDSRLKMVQVEIQQTAAAVNRLQQELDSTPNVISIQKWSDATGSNTQTQEVNPLYVSTAQQLSEKQAALAEKQGESAGLQSLVSTMHSDLDSLQAELASKRMQQDNLQRDVDRLILTSGTLAQKGTETQIAKSIDLGDTSVMVISEANIPTSPVKPNKKLNMAIAMLLGLMVFTLLAFILEYLDNTIKTPEDVTRELGLPVLGIIPMATSHNTQQHSYGGY